MINIRNHNDHNCFLLCYTAAYHLRYKPDLIVGRLVDPKLEETDPHTYTKPGTHQASDDFFMPMSLNMIPQFERLNNVQVNVFQYQKGDLIPMIVSKFESSDIFIMDLLLLYEPGMHHFVLIKDLLRFVCEVRKQKFRSFLQLCRNCFQIHYNEIDHKTHERLCKDHEPAVVIMPTAENGCIKYKFKNFQALWYAPIVVYFDFESFLNPVTTCMNNPQISSSRVLEKHEPSGYSMVAIDHESSEPFFFSLDSSENCLENFIKELHLLARDVYIYKRKVLHYLGDRSQLRREETLTCWICQENFSESEEKCLDHCHSSGKFLGWTHDKCNLARRNINYIPVVGHNLQNYDMHHICLALNECDSRSTIQVIPSTDEKYISLIIGVVVKTITRKDQTTQNIYEYLRFIDSFKFLNSSLQKLVDNLPDNKFTILENHFQKVSQTCRTLIRRKGFYPYNYMTDRKKFDEKKLPPLGKWVNSLDGDKIAISADNLVEAKEVFNQFNCQNLRDYHDLYLSCDTLLLACVFEEFRSISYETYSLDCAHHFTASNLAGDAFKRVCKADVELLTDRDHLDMVEKMMRGGTASIFEKRQFTANNRQMNETFNSSVDTTYGFMVDANNLYGGVMQTHKLPARHFETIGGRTLIRRKGFYAYNYMTDRKKFDEKELPPLEKWVNSLDGDKIAISADNLVEAKEVFNQFNCQNLRDYHDLYLSCDTLLLACVFEEFRSISYETYSLDCAHHFTASNLAGDAFKRVCKADVELLTDRDHLDMVEKMMRGGTASIFEKRQFTANNRQMNETFNSSVDTTYGFMVDANNLYGGVMQTHKLPARHFETIGGRTLIRRKGFYAYNYMTDRKKFDEKELPPLEKWVNSLDGDKIAISADNLVEAKEVFNQFNCQNLRDYHDLYLSCDTLLLACVFEEFRSISYETYSLDCAHHFTASNLAGDAFKRVCKADVELLTDRDHLDMVEKMMRGGTASIFEKRQFTANNRQMNETFNSSEDTTYGFMVDANNLYGGVMQTHKLPARHFETIGVRNERNNQENEDENSMSIEEILATPDDSDYGYIVEIDLKYPQLLHESHRDYPLAPTKEVVQKDWLSRYQTNISEQMKNNENCGPTIGKMKKLLQTLHDKTPYIIHYKVLKLYVKLGFIVTKLYRIVKFKQELWLEPYITLNTNKRKAAKNKFEEALYKLLINSIYGKMCESKRKRMKIKILRDAEETMRNISKFEFETYKIFGEDMVALTLAPTKIRWDVPTIVGACILELAKFEMYKFHYEVMKPNFNCHLLYSDTDSLMYEIKTEKNSNFYEKLYEKREILDNFDFSNYPSDHFLYNVENKLTVLKFKDEFSGDIITEFVALKPKLYSILSQSKYISFNNTGSKLLKQRFLFSKIKKFRKNFLKNFEKIF